jgi:hypothetical protein
MTQPNIVNREKASSHPLQPGRFYTGFITFVDSSGRVDVRVNDLNTSFSKVLPVGATSLNKLSVNDSVVCTFTNEFFNELIVLGHTKIKNDVFASKTVVESLLSTITSLQNQIVSLGQRVTALENA